MNSDMMKYMANPKSFTLKKWFAELLKERYQKHDSIIERVATSLVTDTDLQDFGKLVTEVYESAYRKAVNDYQVELDKIGVKVAIVGSNQ